MSSSSELVLAPFKDEYKFQDLCKDLWTRKYPAARVQPYGRRGQRQHGVDVSVIDERSSLSLGIQCKAAQFDDSPLTKNELRDEVTAAKEFAPKLTLYIIATTRKTDQAIQDEANKLSADLVREGLFPVQIMSWAEILSELKFYPDLLKTYFPEFDWSALSKEQDGQLDYVRTLIHHYRASEAQRYLAIMRERAWANTEAKIQSKILTLEAHVKLLLARHSEANALLEEAFHLDPYPEERQCNYAHVCLATDRLTECRELLDRVLKQNPTNPQAFAISVMLTGRTLPLEEVISEVPEELRRNFRVAASIGDLARSAGQLDVAIAWYREATKNAPLYDCDLRAILAELLLSKVLGTHGFAAGKAPVRDDAEKIKEVENLLSNSIAGIAEEEVMAVRHPWLFNCSVANAILGSLDVARNYADRALTFEPNNSLYLSHRAKLDLSRGDGTPSEFLKRVPLSERESSDWSLLYAEALRKEGKKQDAIAILQGFLEGTQNETHRTAAYRLLVELLLEIKLYDDAHSVLNRAEAELPSRPEFLILRAKYSIAMGDRESATKLADEAANALDSDDVFYLRRSLAGVFHNLGQFGRAAKELQVLAAVSHDPSINEGILDNLLRAQDFKEALTLAQQLLLADGPSPFVSDAAASAFERTGRLGEALKICDDLLLKMPAEPAIQIRKAMLLFRMGRIAEADAILDCRFDLSKTSAASCLNLARLLGALGRYHEAIDAAYETRRRFFRSSEAHNTFMASYFGASDIWVDHASFG